jgi:outer membrane lipoprotein-sorting protein
MNADLHEQTRGPRLTLTVVCLVALFWLVPGRQGFADGIDDVPQRFAEAQSFRLRGWEWIQLFDKQQQTLRRMPIEIIFKRPGKFRDTATFVTFINDKPTDISQNVDLCDGKREWFLDGDNKSFRSYLMSPLDALLRTKTIEQDAAESAVLGSPDAVYRQVGTENQGGRRLDVYEARYQTETGATLARIWLDPKTGLPARVVHDKLDAKGKTSPEMELTEIAVNIPLADALFHFDGPKQTKTWEDWIRRSLGLEAPEQVPPSAPPPRPAVEQPAPARPVLGLDPNAISLSGDVRLECWYAVRVSDNAALVVWRRSAPAAQADTAPDWLSNLKMVVPDSRGDRGLRHQWIYQSLAADRWNWSLVVPADRKSFARGQIRLTLRSSRSVTTLKTTPLRLGEDDLRQLLRAAHDAMLPKSLPEISLPYLQAVARKLSSAESAD